MDPQRIEWLQDRKSGIGSSEAPILMGVSPWSTPVKLYEEKISTEIKEETSSYVMDIGNRLEPKIRAAFEEKMGMKFPAANVKMEQMPFLRASLDGFSECQKYICEIKYSGQKDWELAKMGIVPDKYFPQCQHGLMVSGAMLCYYLSYPYEGRNDLIIDMNKLAIVMVEPDLEYIGRMQAIEIEFWTEHVLKRIPPKPCDKDYVPIIGMAEVAREYKKACKQIADMEILRDHYKEIILEKAKESGHTRLICAGIKIRKETRAGVVEYARIPELQNVDLDSYRKPNSTYWKFEVDK